MTAVLLSIKPKFCELIISGEKTIEVRKTRPKIDTPFKCYIYCTLNGSVEFFKNMEQELGNYEAVCKWNKEKWGIKKGKVIGEFVCDKIENFKKFEYSVDALHRHIKLNACINYDEIREYLGAEKCGYGWYISDLVIYDRPKELSELHIADKVSIKQCTDRQQVGQPEYKTAHGGWIKGSYYCMSKGDWCDKCKTKPAARPPQSWCYVDELEETPC